jgi:hypothetical protein
MGDRDTACRAFERAAVLDPYDEDNIRNLGLCSEHDPEQTAEP